MPTPTGIHWKWALTLLILGLGQVSACRYPLQVCAFAGGFCAFLDSWEVTCWGFNPPGLGRQVSALGDEPSETGLNTTVLEMTDPLSVSCGTNHVCSHFSDGEIRCFGDATNGRLGTGTNLSVIGSAPNQMGANLTAFRRGDSPSNPLTGVFLGPAQTCIRGQTRVTRCAGVNTQGQLMVGSTTNIGVDNSTLDGNMPAVNVSSTEFVIKAVFSSTSSCWLLNSSRLKCGGTNLEGQLGYSNLSVAYGSTIVGDAVPYVDFGTNQSVIDVCMGSSHTCVIRSNGTRSVLCFGKGSGGRLGRGSTSNYRLLPNQTGDDWIPNDLGTSDIPEHVYCAQAQTCVLFDSGRAKCWGMQQEGQLGVGTLVSTYGDTPQTTGTGIPFVQIPPGLNITSIALGDAATCFLLSNNQLACFGGGQSGQLFLGEKSSRGFIAQHVNSGIRFADFGGCPKPATTAPPPPPSSIAPLRQCRNETDDVVVSLNGRTPYGVCASTIQGQLRCWGNNVQGLLLQNGTDVVITRPGADMLTPQLGTERSIVHLAGSLLSTCAVFDDNQMKCWGANTYGNLLLGNTTTHGTSNATIGVNLPFANLLGSLVSNTTIQGLAKTWGNFMCAWFDDGRAKCWGRSDFHQLGYDDGRLTLGDAPGEVGTGLPFHRFGNDSFVFVEGGFVHTCAVLASRRLVCWGSHAQGATGYGQAAFVNVTTGFPIPNITVPLPADKTVHDLCLMYDTTCVITVEDSEVYCWGNNQYGQTGLGIAAEATFAAGQPTDLGSSAGKPVDLECGERYVCAIFEDRRVKCWGAVPGLGGSSLTVTTVRGLAPSQMGNNLEYLDLGEGRVRKLFGFNTYMCALMENWALKCWGESAEGALGAGNVTSFGVTGPETMGANLPSVDLGLAVLTCPEEVTDLKSTEISVPAQLGIFIPSSMWIVAVGVFALLL